MRDTQAPGDLPPYSPQVEHFGIDTGRVFLNHGSFGAVPRAVREMQAGVRARLDADPVRFFVEDLEPLLDEARAAMAAFVGCPANDFAFVENASAAVNAVTLAPPSTLSVPSPAWPTTMPWPDVALSFVLVPVSVSVPKVPAPTPTATVVGLNVPPPAPARPDMVSAGDSPATVPMRRAVSAVALSAYVRPAGNRQATLPRGMVAERLVMLILEGKTTS